MSTVSHVPHQSNDKEHNVCSVRYCHEHGAKESDFWSAIAKVFLVLNGVSLTIAIAQQSYYLEAGAVKLSFLFPLKR